MGKLEGDDTGDGEPTVIGSIEFNEAGNPIVKLPEGAARGAASNGTRELTFASGPAEKIFELIGDELEVEGLPPAAKPPQPKVAATPERASIKHDSRPRTGPIPTAADQTGIIRSIIVVTNTGSELRQAIEAQPQDTLRGLEALERALASKEAATKIKQRELVAIEQRLLGSMGHHREALQALRDNFVTAILADEDLIKVLLQEYSLKHPGSRPEALVASWRGKGRRYHRKELKVAEFKKAEEISLKAEREKLLGPLVQIHGLATIPTVTIVGRIEKEPKPDNINLPITREEVNRPSATTEYLEWSTESPTAQVFLQLRPLLIRYRSNADDLQGLSDLLAEIGTQKRNVAVQNKRLTDARITSAERKPK